MYRNGCHLLYAPELLTDPQATLLNNDIFQKAIKYDAVTTGGRGQAWFVEIGGLSAVYRKYMRGGLIARLSNQTYMGLSVENTRSIKEWRMLLQMYEQCLPVPRPIAASICRLPFRFSPFYRAQILVERIANVQTLDQLLSQQPLDSDKWRSVGQCIRRFHGAGVYHADLNANNILLDADFKVYLIDFDKGEIRRAQQTNAPWMQSNLQRLKRSLLKQQGLHTDYHFSEADWLALSSGYEA